MCARNKDASGSQITGRIPNAPRELDPTAQAYWRDYTKALQNAGLLYETDLETLADLCYWESMKIRGRDELPKGKLFISYKDEDTGALKHTQPHAAFANLKTIQSQILTLRAKLGLTLSDRSGLKISSTAQARNNKSSQTSKTW